MTKLTAARALTAHMTQRFIGLATFIAFGVFASMLLACWLLAYFFSGWWWLLIVPFVFLLFVFLVVRLLLLFIVHRIHAEHIRPDQRKALDDFTDKIEQLIEARGTPPIFFVFLSIKDLLIHRDITTIKKLISDTAGLRGDYLRLEKLFNK